MKNKSIFRLVKLSIYQLIMTILVLLHLNIKIFAQQPSSIENNDTTLANQYYIFAKDLNANAKYDSSKIYLFKAISIYEKVLSNSNDSSNWSKYIDCYNYLGRNYRKESDYTNAKKYLNKALKMGLEKFGEIHSVIGKNYYELGRLNTEIDEYEQAIFFLEKSIKIREQVFEKNPTEANQLKIAGSYLVLGIPYYEKGFYSKAETYYKKYLEIKLKLKKEESSAAYNNLAMVKSKQGDYNKALEYYQKSLDINYKSLRNNHPRIALTLNNMGNTYLRKEEYEQALGCYQKSLHIKLNAEEKNYLDIAFSYNNLGIVKFRMRHYDEALNLYRKSLSIKEKYYRGKANETIANGYFNMGNCYRKKSDFNEAILYYQKALDMRRVLFGEDHPDIAESYYEIGKIWEELKKYKRALYYYQKALMALDVNFNKKDIHLNPPLHNIISEPVLLKILQQKGNCLGKLYAENLKELDYLESSLATYRLAIDLVDKMRSGFESDDSKLFLGEKVSSLYEKATKSALQMYHVSNNISFKEQAFAFAQKEKANLLLEKFRESKARYFSGIPEDLCEKEDSLKVNLTFYDTEIKNASFNSGYLDSSQLKKYKDRYFSLKNEFEELRDSLEQDYPKYYQLKYRIPAVSVKEVKDILDEDTALLEYMVIDSSVYIFFISKNVFDITTVKIDSMLKINADSMIAGIINQKFVQYTQHAYILYNYVIEPVESMLEGKKRLVIIPDGVICNIPFEALLTHNVKHGHRKQDYRTLPYLINKFTISYSYCTTLFLGNLNNNYNEPKRDYLAYAPAYSNGIMNNSKATSFLGIDDVRDDILSQEAYLPATRDEVLGIQKIFNHNYGLISWAKNKLFKKLTRVYLGEDATEENLKSSQTQDYRYLHLATHGAVNKKTPALSGLIFSQDTANEDGVLYLGEIYNLKLNADLAVLSACETGDGKWVEGEGIINLTRGFLYSGAKNVMVSLWKVNDINTSKFMIEFYSNLSNRDTMSQALRNTKQKMIAGGYDFAMPFYWASFILIGQ